MSNATTGKGSETKEQMAAMARMVRAGIVAEVDSKGRRLPLRYWVALREIEAAAPAR